RHGHRCRSPAGGHSRYHRWDARCCDRYEKSNCAARVEPRLAFSRGRSGRNHDEIGAEAGAEDTVQGKNEKSILVPRQTPEPKVVQSGETEEPDKERIHIQVRTHGFPVV